MKTSKLYQLANSSPITRVNLKYGDELIKFNLAAEVKINLDMVEQELINQPTYYSFLIMLQSKLIRKFKDHQLEVRALFARKYESAKEEGENNELSRELAYSSEEYIEAHKTLNKYEQDMNDIIGCVKAFEQRKDLLQTLSANIRKERV